MDRPYAMKLEFPLSGSLIPTFLVLFLLLLSAPSTFHLTISKIRDWAVVLQQNKKRLSPFLAIDRPASKTQREQPNPLWSHTVHNPHLHERRQTARGRPLRGVFRVVELVAAREVLHTCEGGIQRGQMRQRR